MPKVSIDTFRESRQYLPKKDIDYSEALWVYWQDEPLDSQTVNIDEVLHIVERPDGNHYLQIANLAFEGTRQELEELLYKWALEEGHLE